MDSQRQTVTGSTECDASGQQIFQILSDPRRIPDWAPGFAERVDAGPDDSWQVTKADKTFQIEVVSSLTAQTVDYLRELAPGKKGGAFLRVLPRPRGGSVIVMTLPVVPGTLR